MGCVKGVRERWSGEHARGGMRTEQQMSTHTPTRFAVARERGKTTRASKRGHACHRGLALRCHGVHDRHGLPHRLLPLRLLREYHPEALRNPPARVELERGRVQVRTVEQDAQQQRAVLGAVPRAEGERLRCGLVQKALVHRLGSGGERGGGGEGGVGI